MDKLKITSRSGLPAISLSRIAQIGYLHFDALCVPCSHAPMQDLLTSPELGKLRVDFHARNKTTALAVRVDGGTFRSIL